MIASAIVLLVLMGISMYAIIARTELRNAVSSIRSLTRVMGERLDENSDAFKMQIDFVTLDGTIVDKLKLLNQEDILTKDLRSLITLRIMSMDEIDGVYLYDLNGAIITKWVRTPNKTGAYQLPDQVDVSMYNQTGAVSIELIDNQVIYNRAIRALENWEVAAYISFVYDLEELGGKLNLLAGEQMQYLALYDSTTGSVICSNDREAAYFEAAFQEIDPLDSENGIFIDVDHMGEMLICSTATMDEGWFLFCAVERGRVFTGKTLILYITLIFTCLSLLLIAAIYYVIGHRLIHPLEEFSKATRKVRDGNYSIELDYPQNNEIGMLAAGFNDMSSQIDVLVNQNLKGNIAFQEMQLSMLRKQVEPHFLYNTLECINALAELGRIEDIRLLTIHFSMLMKSQLDERQFCTIQNEIECVNSFLKIYKIIEGDKLDYHIRVEENCADIVIPAYMIQPIVENAVLHGIRKSSRKGTCSVTVERLAESVRISVADDGEGISPEIQAAIRAYIDGQGLTEQAGVPGVGLRNVIDRIRYIYKGSASFAVYSDAEWGTSVEIVLPAGEELHKEDGCKTGG